MLQITDHSGLGHDMLRFGQAWREADLGLGLSRMSMDVTAEDCELLDHPYAARVQLAALL